MIWVVKSFKLLSKFLIRSYLICAIMKSIICIKYLNDNEVYFY